MEEAAEEEVDLVAEKVERRLFDLGWFGGGSDTCTGVEGELNGMAPPIGMVWDRLSSDWERV